LKGQLVAEADALDAKLKAAGVMMKSRRMIQTGLRRYGGREDDSSKYAHGDEPIDVATQDRGALTGSRRQTEAVEATELPFLATGSVQLERSQTIEHGAELLLMTHSLLLWFHPLKRTSRVLLFREHWRFRGVFRSDATSVVTLTTPDLQKESIFAQVDLQSGDVLKTVPAVKTFDGHEMVRHDEEVYVVSTGTGALNVYNARTLALVRSHDLWSKCKHCHINGVALTPTSIYVMNHNHRFKPSLIQVVDRNDPRETLREYCPPRLHGGGVRRPSCVA
jgi:hypothetical protein